MNILQILGLMLRRRSAQANDVGSPKKSKNWLLPVLLNLKEGYWQISVHPKNLFPNFKFDLAMDPRFFWDFRHLYHGKNLYKFKIQLGQFQNSI
ncbi:hypothetical protein [Algoriphagus aquaeductus]|uniref:hypothetical protein n=1 Tax=Algoriphagus aquaeductus TaxID=475299 RepID=UPI000DAD3813|nr:hypothetical protein [Algoriphagus aquaeductus]